MSTKTGPQRYPSANTSHWYQTKYPGDAMEVNVIVWHSTEGTSLPEYSGGSMAPNFTAVPDFTAKKLTWFQHFDFDVSARALVHAGAVATNTLNVDQVEIVGTCDPTTHAKWTKAGIKHLYMPELPDWAIRDLAAFSKWAHDQHGVPLSSAVTWKAYPGSYGDNGVRLPNAAWLKYSGHCGHQHVPSGNVHGDPGAFPMAAILTAAKGGTTEEDPMALTTDQAAQLKALHDNLLNIGSLTEKDPKGNRIFHGAGYYLAHIHGDTRAIQTAEAAQTAAITALVGLIGSGVDTAAVVTAVQQAIAAAVIKVDVSVGTPTSA